MNPSSSSEALTLTKEVTAAAKDSIVNTILFVPAPFISVAFSVTQNSNVQIGAQDCHYEAKGAYTGSMSVDMVKDLHCSHVLAGHSERRTLFGDTDDIVNKKVHAILGAGLKCILCVGENKHEFDLGVSKEVCSLQLAKGLAGITEEMLKNVIIAYEPVWAIGTGLTATPAIANDVHRNIRAWFQRHYSQKAADNMVIQYGGSVTPETVDQLMAMSDIDGALVGGASLVASKFSRIVNFQAP